MPIRLYLDTIISLSLPEMTGNCYAVFFPIDFLESENCVVLRFERDDLYSKGNISIAGVDCSSVEHAKVY